MTKWIGMLAIAALVGCASDNTASTPIHSAQVVPTVDRHSTDRVADVLGQRLDSMLSSQHAKAAR